LATGPPHRKTRVHSATSWIPFRVLSPPLSVARPVGRIRPSMEFFALQRHPKRSALARVGRAQPNQVPLSGFLNLSAVSATLCSTALFHAAAVPELPPSELSPRQRSWSPLEATGFLRLSTGVQETHRRDLIAADFTDFRARDAVAWLRQRLWDQFSRTEARFPITLGHLRWGRPHSASFTRFEALLPPSSPFAPNQVALARRPLLSWAPAPPTTVPSQPRILRPARPQVTNTDLRPEAPVSDSRDRQPLKPGET